MKKLTALILALAMVFSLAACGGSSESAAPTSSGSTPAPSESEAPQEGNAWTEKNIEIQLPASAGGGTDVVGRALSNYINQQGDHNLTIVNNTDGAGVVAFETVRNSDPEKADTLLFFHTTMLIKTATQVYDKAAADDFTVITVGIPEEKGGYVLVVPSDSEYQTMDDFVAAAQANPGSILIGVETGGSSHVMSGLLAQAIGAELNFVEAGSDTEKLTALMSGSIDCALVNANQAKQYLEAGEVIGLGCFSRDEEGARNSIIPDVPSFIEQGYDLTFSTNFFVLGPLGMDEAVCEEIAAAFAAAAEDPATDEILTNAGQALSFTTYAEAREIVADQQEQITPVVESLGLVQN